MLLLAVDTSGKNGSIALARIAADTETLEVVPLSGGTFSAQLVPQVAALLSRHGHTKLDLDGFVVASGPGSFTGLRVGLAAVKALAEVLRKPIAVVSLLEAVAGEAPTSGKILAALDAGRGEIYVGKFAGGGALGETLLSTGEFVTAADGFRIVTPDETVANVARQAGLQPIVVARPQSDAIARLGGRRLQRQETVTAEDLEANYIRRSDAEIFSRRNP